MLWFIWSLSYNQSTSFVSIALLYNFGNVNLIVSIMSYWKLKHSLLIHQSSTYNNLHLIIDSIRNKLSMSSKSSWIISTNFILFLCFLVNVSYCNRASYYMIISYKQTNVLLSINKFQTCQYHLWHYILISLGIVV